MVMQNPTLPQSAPRLAPVAARFFRGLGDPTRLHILELLLEGERNVGELVERLAVSQAKASNHLACLKWCGYVTARRQGKCVYYQISDPRVRSILDQAYSLIADNAEYILSCVRI